MKNEIAILLADGFEEIEALAPADIWRRLGLTVKLAGVTGKIVTSTRGIPVTADLMISELNADDLQLVYLPGGLPGATNLRDDSRVIELIQKVHADGGFVERFVPRPSCWQKPDFPRVARSLDIRQRKTALTVLFIPES